MIHGHSLRMLSLGLLVASSLLAAQRVRLQEGTEVHVRLKSDLLADQVSEGNPVYFDVAQPIIVQGLVVVPAGGAAWGAVQSVKKKEIKFDIAGIKLPSGVEIKLRSLREKSSNPAKDVVKVETRIGDTVGASRGSEFTAYVDEDKDLEGVPVQPAVASRPRPAPPRAETPAVSAVTPKPVPAPVAQPSAPPAAPPPSPAVAAPVPPPAATAAPTSAPAAVKPAPSPKPSEVLPASVERVTVECFSDPSGADILIDGEFVGNTPSILKVPIGNHRLELQLAGYKTESQALDLLAGMGIRTIRKALEKKE